MELSMSERRAVTKKMREEYGRAGRKGKKALVDQLVRLHEYGRQHAARVLRGAYVHHPGTQRTRQRRYGKEVHAVLRRIWHVYDHICGKKLAACMSEAVGKLTQHGEVQVTNEEHRQLHSMSAATIDRLLAVDRAKVRLKSRARTQPGSMLKHRVPVRTHQEWGNAVPGEVQMDLVGHDGGNARGDFNHTLDVTDVATAWTETRAVLNKAQVWVLEQLKDIQSSFPFLLTALHSDSGGEFINHHLDAYAKSSGVKVTKGRTGKKNDNCYVEEKNWSIVRRLVGYGRYEGADECTLLNTLYRQSRLYTNFFIPVTKLKSKERIGSRIIKRYDKPQTPYQRVLDSAQVPEEKKRALRQLYARLNPAELKRRMTQLQNQLLQRAMTHQRAAANLAAAVAA